jgi:hypothetical protein
MAAHNRPMVIGDARQPGFLIHWQSPVTTLSPHGVPNSA